MPRHVGLITLLLCSSLPAAVELARGEEPNGVDFALQVRPILSDKCFFCHGPDAAHREADLRLDLEEGAKDYAVVPGKPDESELIRRIASNDEDERMPPAATGLKLSKSEIDLLRNWIKQGAPWNTHWSLKPIGDPSPPNVRQTSWPRNEIDRFILARLEREGLSPAGSATRERLIRRVCLDITGLPPTLAQLDEFLADNSPAAYEKLVDRLLASERFGEHMAASWLDVARYSDTYGYQVDRDRYVWPWRDWVIRAFNENLPYDRFITQQLAGDLLPNASDDEILATAFNRLHPQKVEGGSTPEEFRIEYVSDRTETFATAFLGLTFVCARCHDHKYDPISQKEYYQISAFFDNIDEAGLYSYFTPAVPTPTLWLTDNQLKQKIADVEGKIADEERQLAALADARREEFQRWLNGKKSIAAPVAGRVAYLDFEEPPGGANESVPGKIGKGVRLTGDDAVDTKVGNFRRFEPFSVALWLNTPDVKERAVVFHRSRAWTDAGSRGYQLLIEEGRLSASLIHFWPGNAIRVRTHDPIPTGQWLHVAMVYDGSSRADGLRIYLNGVAAQCDIVRDKLVKNITGGGGDHIAIGERFRDRGFTNGLVDEFQVFDRQLTPLEVRQLYDEQSLAELLDKPADKLNAADRSALLAYYLSTRDDAYRTQLQVVKAAREERSKLCDEIPEIMVMQETPAQHQTYLLKRGMYDAHGEEVSPETPDALPPFPADQPRNRLGLARWLTDPNHPLTARVAVNRFWQVMFGKGLVHTPEDFGSQGTPPTHPELLDWLARDFVSHGWDVKRLIKQMVLSATYRQSSVGSPAVLAQDPENRLLGRAPSYRLSAEVLRDSALAVSGLLVNQVGGEPARPYEVAVSFKPVKHDEGPGLYRRSLYTYWKRTGPAPVMMTLDASKRDVCRMRRERTSSPLQAFVLMNGPQFVEAARMLAQRLIKRHGDETKPAIDEMYRLLTSREPSAVERQILCNLYEKQTDYFQQNPQRAEQYLGVGQAQRDPSIDAVRLAAMSTVANTLLNFDETVMKR